MTFEQNSALPKRFVTSVLPWLAGLGALLVYLGTMNQWAGLNSIGTVARVSGWLWQPDLQQPLSFLVLYPFRFLPEAAIPLALNVFNAVLAALVIVLLARTVALLPHDRTPDQRELEDDAHGLFSGRTAWIPPVLAAAVLGLQISFWENATAITGEMIDAFIVAYVIRCLLEFRIDEQRSWLTRAAFLYAAGMTNNWALVGLAPVFLIAVIWVKGLSFFNLGFITRLALWGLVGLLLYLVLPLIQSQASIAPVDFWPGLKYNLASQKTILSGISRFLKENYRVVGIAATSLLPLLIIAMRWRSSFGDNSPLGVFIAKAVFHSVHALFMAICLLVVLSPPYSPRQMLPGLPFLTHYYFGAIAIGYCAGYFLLICGVAFRARSRMHPILKFIRYIGFGLIITVLVIMPVTLVRRNLDPVKLANGRLVEDLARSLERDLPKPPCAVLSDNPDYLALLKVHLQKQGRAKDYLFFDTQSAKWTDYHAFQNRKHPDLWPATFATATNRSEITDMGLIFFVRDLMAKQPVYYLQPSFGYYFEAFEMSPKGLVFQLSAYPSNILLRTELPAGLVQANEKFWTDFDANSLPVLTQCLPNEDAPRKTGWQTQLESRLHLAGQRSLTAEALARFYSRAATHWAVELQRLGKWDEATNHLGRALILNPDNIAAQVNLEFNQARRRDGTARTATRWSPADFQEQRLVRVLNDSGPFDEPRFTFEQGRTYLSGRLNRQAFQQIHRVVELEPANYVANIWLADLYSMLGQPAEALRIAQHIRASAKAFALVAVRELDLARVEATAHLRLNEPEKAKAAFSKVLTLPEADNPYRAMVTQLYLQSGQNAEALPLLDQLIADNPADTGALANRGYACLQMGRYAAAKESLTRALELDPKNGVVRLNRAITQLRAKEFDAAREDYNVLLKEYPEAYQVHFGLGEIAAAQGDMPGAIAQFEICLKAAPVGTPDFLQVSNRLAEIKFPKK